MKEYKPSSFGFTTQQLSDYVYSFICVVCTVAVVSSAIWFVYG